MSERIKIRDYADLEALAITDAIVRAAIGNYDSLTGMLFLLFEEFYNQNRELREEKLENWKRQPIELKLPEGSEVTLMDGTVIRFPVINRKDP